MAGKRKKKVEKETVALGTLGEYWGYLEVWKAIEEGLDLYEPGLKQKVELEREFDHPSDPDVKLKEKSPFLLPEWKQPEYEEIFKKYDWVPMEELMNCTSTKILALQLSRGLMARDIYIQIVLERMPSYLFIKDEAVAYAMKNKLPYNFPERPFVEEPVQESLPPEEKRPEWDKLGLPRNLRRLALELSDYKQHRAGDLEKKLGRAPSKILSDNSTGKWMMWIDDYIDHKGGMYKLKKRKRSGYRGRRRS